MCTTSMLPFQRALVLLATTALVSMASAGEAPSAWTTARVQRWALEELALPDAVAQQFALRLKEEELTGSGVLGLDKDELRELGLSKMGHLKAVGAAIAELAAEREEAVDSVPEASSRANNGAAPDDDAHQALKQELKAERRARHNTELQAEKQKEALAQARREKELHKDERHKAELEKERELRRQVELGLTERQMEAQRAGEREREASAERGARERAEARSSNDRYDTRADRAESADRRGSSHEKHMERNAAADRAHEERSETRHAHNMERETKAKTSSTTSSETSSKASSEETFLTHDNIIDMEKLRKLEKNSGGAWLLTELGPSPIAALFGLFCFAVLFFAITTWWCATQGFSRSAPEAFLVGAFVFGMFLAPGYLVAAWFGPFGCCEVNTAVEPPAVFPTGPLWVSFLAFHFMVFVGLCMFFLADENKAKKTM